MYPNKVWICLTLVFTSFAAMLDGFQIAFNVYALILRETFNFTQTEVEVVASMGTIGLGITFLEAFITKACGYTITSWILTTSVFLSSLFFALVILYRDALEFHLLLVSVIQLVMSTVVFMTFVAMNRVCINILPEKHHGKVISFALAFVSFGKIFYGVLVDNFFYSNLSGLFFTIAILLPITLGTSFFFLHPFVTKDGRSDDKIENDFSEPLVENQNSSIKDMFRSPFFHGLFWTTVLFYACGFTCLNNVTIIAESIGVKSPIDYVYVFSVTIAFLRPVSGILFDTFRSEICGFSILMVNFVCFIASMIIGIFALDTNTMFLSTILYGVGFASSMATGMSICLLRFGRTCFDGIMGMFYLASSALQVVLQVLFGYFFDLKGEEQGLNRKCYGRECFFWPFVMMLIISTVTGVIQLLTCLLSNSFKPQKEQKSEDK